MSSLERRKAQAAMDGKLAEPTGWTAERIERLIALAGEGHSMVAIAKELGGTSRNAVIGKLHRMGIKMSPAARAETRRIGNKNRTRPTKPVSAASSARDGSGQIKGRPRNGAAGKKKAPIKPQPQIEAAMADADRQGLPLMSLQRAQCRWPVNSVPKGGQHLFCGDKADPGRSYCPHHARRAVRPSAEVN